MQEQKINTEFFLAIQNTYEEIEVALFNQNQFINKISIHKNEASKNLLKEIENLLNTNHIKTNDLSFIAVNKGPGPFTTLRVVITTANAINFARATPLIEVNGLEAFQEEMGDAKFPVTVILLNAFNNDVYYAISSNELNKIGYKNIKLLLEELKEQFNNQQIRFLGNGTTLFANEIKTIFNNNAFIPENIQQTCSIEQIAKTGYKKWKNKEILEQIVPLYLKDAISLKK